MKIIYQIADDAISILEDIMVHSGKHVINRRSIEKYYEKQMSIHGFKNDCITDLLLIGRGQVIETRLNERGYKSAGNGYFVNIEKCADADYLAMVYMNNESSVSDREKAFKKLKIICDGQGVFDENGKIKFNPNYEEVLEKIKADAV